jgi:hypothetical protein
MLKRPCEAGTLLLEALIALLLIATTTSAIAIAIKRNSRLGDDIRKQLEPNCDGPICSDESSSLSCACGSRRWSVVR